MIPVINNTDDTITYGLYPQSRVKDNDALSALEALTATENNGWYLYNDEDFTKLSAKPFQGYSKFDDGTRIEANKTYWFKCEPITWTIFNKNNNVYSLVPSVLLDTHIYDSDSNNYEESNIRSWLNG